jgi:hypothetical protein
VDVPETEAALVKKGDLATIRFPALNGKSITGPVARSSWSLDSQSRTLRAEIDLANADGVLRPNTYAVASISVETPMVRTVPAKALVKAGETMAFFIVKDQKAMRIRVKVGRSDGEFTEVAQWQKADGSWDAFTDAEVIANAAAVTDGQSVTVGP